MSSDLHKLIYSISDSVTAKGVIRTMITNSLGIFAARANAECLEDMLGIMLGDEKAAYGRRRRADTANKEVYEEYSRHFCSGDGGHSAGRSRH